MTQPTVLIMAAGTGGHIFPALSIARHLQARGVHIEWLGTPSGMENDVLRDTNINLNRLAVNGLRGKGLAALVKAPFMLLRSIWQAIQLLRRIKPCCVLGMGGYVTGPGGIAAWVVGRPLLIHEQNAVAGTSNKLLRPFARRVLQAFPDTFPAAVKVMSTGNPVRSEITAMSGAQRNYFDASRPLRLLVLGGSLGAAAINELVPATLAASTMEIEVWHQTGRNKLEETLAHYQSHGLISTGKHKVVPFISDMSEAYRWADIVLCRSGAGTLAEIAVAGLPSVLVPYPHAIDDHQTANARWLADAGAAVLVPQSTLSVANLTDILENFLRSPQKLFEMAQAARTKAVPDAGETISAICMEICRG
ncbi:MAG: undecaprenyldiphospho-muramoylpentapeptide beta-N-acetylglucosaminyltransferase [Pseudohongiella sp.]|nr:undecaprenyldiphospho-muramoylpentapeptide beta-N-acetylglucosaminyltransferase [Pseudohongiella sp.]MDO9520883.1 undecaprenyldiphospho-muramoylpentapeptide beta-N-acetylglucosaminyltransferase [Pseudohongiella sp.]MDP2128054.1 undecaprenyldiphospho-muramoylpentapeptide beta-N-acetylglucosaminyltransferase [Pseudohongiella sp.]